MVKIKLNFFKNNYFYFFKQNKIIVQRFKNLLNFNVFNLIFKKFYKPLILKHEKIKLKIINNTLISQKTYYFYF